MEELAHTSVEGTTGISIRKLQRQLAALLPQAHAPARESPLELSFQANDAPRLISATVIEGRELARREIAGGASAGFRAFLDGTQKSVVAAYVSNVPIVHGQAAAVVRERRDRRMHTWHAPLVESRIYAPRTQLAAVTWGTLTDEYGALLVDTSEKLGEFGPHPYALRDAAYHAAQAHRERLEQRLAEEWCGSEHDPLFIDGGISGSEQVAGSRCAVGVVKSHRTLYAEGAALGVLLALPEGARSSVFRIPSAKRAAVASWYLRLRNPAERDPMWGLVRVETALPSAGDMDDIGPRADAISRWVLAEVSPLALPDARWDKLMYGVRDCEEFLRAIA